MGLLTEIKVAGESDQQLEVRLNTTRMLLIVGICVAALTAAAVLHGLDQETAAAWFTGLGEALLFAAFGTFVGEVVASKEAAERLRERVR